MGKLIVIEGLDGSGKSTQLELLPQNLKSKGIDCKTVSFPDYDNPSSTLVKMYLAGEFGKNPNDVNAFAASTFYCVDRYASFKANWGKFYNDGGTVIAGFIPYLSGSIAIVDRYFFCPAHVNASNLSHVFETGKFHNLASNGFQEGYYATAAEMKQLFEDNGFETTCIRSIRGFAYEKEDMIYGVKDEDVLAEIIKAIDKTAENPAIVEMCGHAVYVGK